MNLENISIEFSNKKRNLENTTYQNGNLKLYDLKQFNNNNIINEKV